MQRWQELLQTPFPPRRARTLSSCAAVEEATALAEAWLRSGGQSKPSIEPDEGGHGVQMLPDVAAEAERAVQRDAVLAARCAQRRDVLLDGLRRLRADKPDEIRSALGQLNALLPPLRRDYLRHCFDELHLIATKSPTEQGRAIELVEACVAELRSQGWSDSGLLELHDLIGARDEPDGIVRLGAAAMATAQAFTCYVALTLPADRPPFPNDDETLRIVDTAPATRLVGRPLKRGPYARVVVAAHDAMGAAAIAHRRILSTIGALTVFLSESRIDVSSEVVGVDVGDGVIRGCEVQERLAEESRFANVDDIRRIVASSWTSSASSASDPLYDAIRLRHRALYKADAEIRLLLLWSAIERLTSGARGFRGALSAAKELVSHAVTFGKLRRDVGDLAAAMEHAVVDAARTQLLSVVGGYCDPRTGGERINRQRVLACLLGDEPTLKTMLAPLYESAPLLACRAHGLWTDLGCGDEANRGRAAAEYHERSRQRVAWQVGRIYRARNRVAHVGSGPERTKDLVAHAHFYLTQLIAICVHYNESRPIRPQELLSERVGQYEAYIGLLRKGDGRAISPASLMRPTQALDA